jgi:hypothetical protein
MSLPKMKQMKKTGEHEKSTGFVSLGGKQAAIELVVIVAVAVLLLLLIRFALL